MPGEFGQGLGDPGILVEEVVLWGKRHGDPELLEEVRPASLSLFLLVDVGDEKPGEDADARTEDRDLSRERCKRRDERHRERADQSRPEELEAEDGRASPVAWVWWGHGAGLYAVQP